MLNNIVMHNMLNECVYSTSSASSASVPVGAIAIILGVALVGTIAIVRYILSR